MPPTSPEGLENYQANEVPEQVAVPTIPIPAAPIQEAPILSPSPLTDETYNEIMGGNKDAFAGYIQQAMQIGRQQVMTEIRPILHNMVDTRAMFDGFFSSPDNRDLLPVVEFFKQKSMEVEAASPGVALPEVLKTTAGLVREQLGIVRQEIQETTEEGSPIVRRRVTKRKVGTAKNGGVAPGTRARRKVVVPKSGDDDVANQLDQMRGI
jgi:hypothetical protein